MLWVLGRYNFFNSSSAGTVNRRQNLTSIDVRFWRLKTVPVLKGLMQHCLAECWTNASGVGSPFSQHCASTSLLPVFLWMTVSVIAADCAVRGSACVLLQDHFWSAPCSTPAAAHVPTSQTSLPCSPSTWKRVMTAQIRSLGSSVSMSQVTLLILTRTASTFSYRDKNYNREGNV